jgi:hypothetical protein
MKRLELFLGVIVSLSLITGTSWASEPAQPLIGRVSALAGQVQYHSTAGEWSAALVNEPVATGTSLHTAQDAETELRLPGTQVALAPSTALQILRFDNDTLQIEVHEGRIGLHLDAGAAAKTVEIDLPQGGVWLDAPGDYGITAGDANTPASIQVFAGKAQLGGGLDPTHIAAAATGDWFSEWWRSQGDSAEASQSPSPNVAGAGALAAAGRWEPDSQLGNVWYPSDVAADWTPYRDGMWRFLAPWGWTWIDSAPWGFAPSHYGRWARVDDRWGWVPGEHIAAASYNPAVVAFLGTAGIGLSRPGDGGAAVAWFPLAPGEAIGDGNDANYQNRRFAAAVPRAVFAVGSPVATALIDDVPNQRFVDAPVILGALDIPPTDTASPPVAAAKNPTPSILAAASAATAAPPAAMRRPFVVSRRDAPLVRVVAHVGKRLRLRVTTNLASRLRIAAAIASRTRHLASALHSPHNRTHLAAARGGA